MSSPKAKVQQKSPSLDASFRAHYNEGVERDRLLGGTSNLEFERTKQILSRYLPRKPATVLNVGGGPGRYSFWLAEMGYSVHLVDVLPLHIRRHASSKGAQRIRLQVSAWEMLEA